jgi:hypothetical protein
MKTFQLMVDGRDATGRFLVTLTIVANSLGDARSVVEGHAAAGGWAIVAYEEASELGQAGRSQHRGVCSETGRTYFDADNEVN